MFRTPSDERQKAKEARQARARVGRDLLAQLDDFWQAHEAEFRQQFIDIGCAPNRVEAELQQMKWDMQVRVMRELDARAREIALRKAAAVRDQRHVEDVSGEPRP